MLQSSCLRAADGKGQPLRKSGAVLLSSKGDLFPHLEHFSICVFGFYRMNLIVFSCVTLPVVSLSSFSIPEMFRSIVILYVTAF